MMWKVLDNMGGFCLTECINMIFEQISAIIEIPMKVIAVLIESATKQHHYSFFILQTKQKLIDRCLENHPSFSSSYLVSCAYLALGAGNWGCIDCG